MMPDLRARLKAVAARPKAEKAACACQTKEVRVPLHTLGGDMRITADHVRWLGMDCPGFDVRRTLFLDTETTGLRGAGTVAFLVGLGWLDGDDFVVRQLLMRDYPEEVSLLEETAAVLERLDSIVTFNGKSFDVPLLRDRFVMARLRDRWREQPHLDLLHAARRTWKLRLGTCTLGNLEAAELGIHREGDLPGAEVPERFFAFLKTGDASLLDDVLRHNAQDIQTLYVLLGRLAGIYGAPEAQTSMLDVLSVGRALERAGEGERARRCFQVASVSTLSGQARLHLARSYRRERDYAQAAAAYRGMISQGEADVEVYKALAILLERYLQDIPGALAVTEQALWRFAGGGFLHRASPEALAALEKRRIRLRRRSDKLAHASNTQA